MHEFLVLTRCAAEPSLECFAALLASGQVMRMILLGGLDQSKSC